ncbi:MAG: molybdate ABC transporter substrate-binding protein [Proteobacteria bacterium]|nr:molybdate ABC transporter substrate-binding protein [Pseudomonadota bacterium]
MRIVTLLLLLLSSSLLCAEVVHIASATNFKATVEKINALFEAQSTHKTTLSSASTGILFSQIRYGAPFDVFFAADKISPLKLAEEGHGAAGEPFCYALGTLVLMGSQKAEDDLNNPALSLAIANPNTAPYGKAAMEILRRPEFAAAVGRKLVRANNAIQAYQHWYSATVDLALVPLSLAAGKGAAISPSWYTPLEQHVILLKKGEGNPAVIAYMRWIRSEQVQTLIGEAGYGSCQ